MIADGVAIAFYKGYRIIDGEVVNTKTGRIRKIRYSKRPRQMPYPRFNVWHNRKTITIQAHQLSAYQKYGLTKYEKAMVVRHKNNNVEDFSYSNILLGTQSQNIKDQGSNHYCHVFTDKI